MNPSPHLVAGAALLVGALSAAATEPGPPWGGLDPEARSRALQQKAELPRLPQSDFAWASLGPDRLGGRTTAVAYGGSSGTSFWMGSAGGGLWFSQDFGVNFEQRFVLWPSIGAVAVDPIDSLHVLCGTGDSSGAPDAQPGGGIFASSDGGETWIARGAAALHHVHRIVFGEGVVLAAGGGALSGNAGQGGIYRSTDNGESFDSVFETPAGVTVVDLVQNPGSAQRWLAATWEHLVTAAGVRRGGPDSGVYRSIDGGQSWQRLDQGLPAGDQGRIGVAIGPTGEHFALLADTTGTFAGLYASDDQGDHWSRRDDSQDLSDLFDGASWPLGGLATHPVDPDLIYALGQQIRKSSDGGANWFIPGPGADHMALSLQVFPGDGNRLIAGTDTAVWRSLAGGLQWVRSIGPDLTQLEAICVSTQDSTGFYAGSHHYGVLLRTGEEDWRSVVEGDVDLVRANPRAPRYVFASTAEGLLRSDDYGLGWSPAEEGIGAGEPVAHPRPLVFDPLASSTLFTATDRVYRSDDHGASWQTYSDPLETGVPISALGASSAVRRVCWAGTSQGRVFVTDDIGANWTERSVGLPAVRVSGFAPATDDLRATHISLAGRGEAAAWVFHTTNGGTTWGDIGSGLPEAPVHALLRHPLQSAWIYVATEVGVFMSPNDGRTWGEAGTGLPAIPATDLWIDAPTQKLLAATWGRSAWWVPASESPVHVAATLPVRPRRLGRLHPNPFNPRLHIPLELERAGEIELNVYDLGGRLVRMLHRGWIPAGSHAWTWEGYTEAGLAAPSGAYTVRLLSGSAAEQGMVLLLR